MLTWHTYTAHFRGNNHMDGTVLECVDLDVHRIHDIVKAHAREARYFHQDLDIEITKDGQYFACAWATACGAGAIGFSGNRDTRGVEIW